MSTQHREVECRGWLNQSMLFSHRLLLLSQATAHQLNKGKGGRRWGGQGTCPGVGDKVHHQDNIGMVAKGSWL